MREESKAFPKVISVALSVKDLVKPIRVAIANIILELEKVNPESILEMFGLTKEPKKIKLLLGEPKQVSELSQSKVSKIGNQITVPLLTGLKVRELVLLLKEFNQELFIQLIKNNHTKLDELVIENNRLSVKTSAEKQKEIQTPQTKATNNVVSIAEEKLMLIDGSNLLSRCYYATSYHGKLMQTSDGRYTNAVYGMVQSFFGLLKRHKPTHVAICWDESRDRTWRRELYPEYKALRDRTEPELKEQYPLAKRVLAKMDVPQFRIDRYEADDIIGTLANKWIQEKEVGKVLIVSSDKDMHQLLNDRTTQLLYHKGEEVHFTTSDFEEKYGIKPYQWKYAKAILGETGKSSDNIPGISGVGPKAVFPLLQKFKTLDGIYEDLSKLEPDFKRYVKKIEESKEDAYLTLKLATIVTDITNVINDWQSLRIKMNKKGTVSIFQELEFNQLLQQIS